MLSRHSRIAGALAAFPLATLAPAAGADEPTLAEVVVTAPQMRAPLVVETDPKTQQQPVPASDGGGYLKNIPGFSVIRKGGTGGDPVLRGLAGSRLNVLLDGAEFLGGCGMRMDPPTAYVFPEAYDRVRIVKGPQTVLYGNGNLAGVVSFERDAPRFEAPGGRAYGSLMAGSWGRRDGVVDAALGAREGFLRAIATHSESDDYRDGAGRAVHALFERRSLNAQGGWTPDDDTSFEVSAARSEARAAYADRMMDGSVFDRDGFGLKVEKRRLSPLWHKLQARVDWNYIDHVMDNYSLRAKPPGMNFSWSNPDRRTLGARLSAELRPGEATVVVLGLDRQDNRHAIRSFSGPVLSGVGSQPRRRDFESSMTGIFGEVTHGWSSVDRIVAGLRLDRFSADRFDPASGAAAGSAAQSPVSGFVRFERDLERWPATVYAGVGRGERPMDYWEATTYNGLTAGRTAEPERNTQLDAGLVWSGRDLSGSLSLFYSRIDDYLLTYVDPAAPGSCGSNPAKCKTFGVDATRHGFEADLAWRFAPAWTLRGSYARVHADNDTLSVPLAQTPPDELRFGLAYESGPWAAGALARVVRRQDRVHVNYGSIVGQDIGPSPGFTTLALNASYRLGKRVLLSAGIDNVFDRSYAEHISRGATAVAGYDAPTTRVNEPGRFVWARIGMSLD